VEIVQRWCLRVGAVAATVVTGWLLPVAAWAQDRPGTVAVGDELARRRPRTGGLGLVGGCCCLVVVLVVVLTVVSISRRRQNRQQPPPPPQYPQ
jgi:uncharacterized membrane-anchored protein